MDKRTLVVVIISALALILISSFIIFSFFSKASYEGELFSAMPGEGAIGASYLELTADGASEAVGLLAIPRWAIDQSVDGAYIAVTEYAGGTRVWSAFIKTSISPDSFVETYGDALGGVVSEKLSISGKEITTAYLKNDSDRKNPICVWGRDGGIRLLALSSDSGSQSSCRISSDFSCRGQVFEGSLLRIKVKSATSERLVVTEAACGGASLSSKNQRYVRIPDIIIGPDQEVWLDEVPCYDSGNLLAKGTSFTGKIFLKYYLESEGAGSPRVASGDVSASAGTQELSGARCIDLLEKSYDSSTALALLSGVSETERLFPGRETRFGSAKSAGPLGKASAAFFERQEAKYAVFLGSGSLPASLAGVFGSESDRCITSEDGRADLILQGAKFACRKEANGLLSGFAYERRSVDGDTFIVVASPSGGPERAEQGASGIAFDAGLSGPDARWKNESSGKVTVYFQNRTRTGGNGTQEPMEGAVVELYSIASEGGLGGFLEAKQTDSSGVVLLEHVPLNGGLAVVSKLGYGSLDGRSKLAQAALTEEGKFSAEVALAITFSESDALADYMFPSNSTRLLNSQVEARGTFPSLSALGVSLVNSSGNLGSVVAVGKAAPPREVLAAAEIGVTLASRQFQCDVLLKNGEYKAEPAKPDRKLLFLDSENPDGVLIAVGDPETNAILRGAVGLSRQALMFVEEKGGVIAVFGKGSNAMMAAEIFVSNLNRSVPACGGNTFYGTTKIIDSTGNPAAKVVIGEQASTEEALAGAYIATHLASLSSMCVRVSQDTTGCREAKPTLEKVVVREDALPAGYGFISVGGPTINGLSFLNCKECAGLYGGEGTIRAIGGDIYLSGYRLNDTLYSASEFSRQLSNPMPSFQKQPYRAIKVSGFIMRDSGHHEISLSFFDDAVELQSGKAVLGEFYVMQGGPIATISSVSARSVGTALVTFDFLGQKIQVGLGRFLCASGAVEDTLNYCVKERSNTSISLEASPNPATFMGKLEVFADYRNDTGDVLGANCSYCIMGRSSVCRKMEYKGVRENRYADELIIDSLPMGVYLLEANCSAEGQKNASAKLQLNVTRVQLPDLIVESAWVQSISNTKLTAGVRIKNIGDLRYATSDSSPLVTCLWDGYGRNLFSHIAYNATIEPGGTFEFLQPIILPSIEGNNTLLAKADCNNLQAEEKEDNNEKTIYYGRYG